jgi:hypothetical protein
MEALKVTDPTKIVTDPVLLAHLERQGIDKDFVEFTSDYGKRVKGQSSPYAKFYRDLISGKRFVVITQLPMVDHEDKAIEAGWQKTDKGFAEKNNLFKADVSGLQVTIAVRNDQPDGSKAGHQISYHPQLFLKGIERPPVSENATLLDSDPLNSNYNNNTLEWDYGICKRRLRIIEGRLLGTWIFDKNPGGEVRIRYNQSGYFRLKLGQFRINDDEEVIPAIAFEKPIFGYPFTISDSATFYPDAHTETASVDGYVYYELTELAWANLIIATGNHSDDSSVDLYPTYFACGVATNKWANLVRDPILFDTSGLPDDATISAATISLYGSGKLDEAGVTPNINIYSSNPASNTALTGTDYGTFGSTAFCDAPITYANWLTSSPYWNDFALNAAGLAAISKTGVSKFGTRNANYDVAATPPSWAYGDIQYLKAYSAEQGTGYKPKLVVTYTTAETKTSSDGGSGVEANLATAVMLASDRGSGSEVSGLLKSIFSQDEGGGADSVRMLTGKAGYDLRLHTHRGQVSVTHKEVNL